MFYVSTFQSIPSLRKITHVIIFCRECHIEIVMLDYDKFDWISGLGVTAPAAC